jgi:hypothetical protein
VLALLGLLLTTTQSITTFQYSFNTISRYTPSYSLGYIVSSYSLMVNVSTPGTGADSFTISQLTVAVETDNWPATSVTCTPANITTNVSTIYVCPILVSGRYRVNFTKASSPADLAGSSPNVMQYFQFIVSSYLTVTGGPSNSTAVVTTLVKATETFRDRVARLIYVGAN